MLTSFLKKIPSKKFSGLHQITKPYSIPYRSFCTEPPKVGPHLEEEFRASLKEGSSQLEGLRSYYLDLYRTFTKNLCLIAPSAYFLSSFIPPLGSPYQMNVFLGGAAIHLGSTWKLDRTETTIIVEESETGESQTFFEDSTQRRLLYTISCMGQGWMFAYLTKLGFFAPILLPFALVGGLSSNFGHIMYLKYMKSGFSPMSLFACGTLTGALGMSVLGSGLLAPLGIYLSPDLWFLMTLGVIPYNLSVMRTSKWILKALAYRDLDHLRHVAWLSGSWNSLFYPIFFVFLYLFFTPPPKEEVNRQEEETQQNQ